MIQFQHKKDCCGCGACAQVCPKHCITLTEDAEGFLYPNVDTSVCVRCGLCDSVCPILAEKLPEGPVLQTYAAYARDEVICLASSSGGIFTLLAQQILNQGGVVFGAAFDDDFSVHHIMIEDPQDLPLLRGSKYVQSRIEDTYIQAKTLLEAGRTVLFSGVGCQIAGLKAYLNKPYPQLYTVDVLCHGVPSPKLWRSYLQTRQSACGSPVSGASFRDKTDGWKEFSMVIRFQDGQTYKSPRGTDDYLQFFQEDICLRPSCHDCRFKTLPHPSDLTLGDAWGIESRMPQMHHGKGTSLVLVNTEKGQQLFDATSSDMVFQPGETDRLLPPYEDSRTSVKPHPRRKPFFSALGKGASMLQLRKILQGNLFWKALSFGKRILNRFLRTG